MNKWLLILCSVVFFTDTVCISQTISTLTPNSSLPGQTVDVTIRGINTHFQSGISTADFGAGITVKKLVVANTITATATISVNGSASPGARDVRVTTRGEVVSLPNGFEVFLAGGVLRADIELLPMESISLKDVDLSNPKATPVLFFTNIYNDATQRTVNLGITVSAASKGLLGTISKKNIPISPGGIVKFNNRDYDAVKTNGQNGKDFLNTVELTGVFPPDNYTYVLTVTDISGNVLATASTSTIITNPETNPELITPGGSFTDNIPEVYTPLPLFQWFGHNNRYDFALYECRPGQSAEEVTRNVAVYKQMDISSNSLLYPNSAEKLEDGKTYAWQVQGKSVSATGTHYLPSEVYRFKYISSLGSGKKIVSSIVIKPDEITLAPGQQTQFAIICYDDNGNIVSDATPKWQVTPAYGTVTPTGLFTAGQGGNTVAVLVSAGTATEFATVTIKLGILSNGGFKNPFNGFVKKLFGLKSL